MRTVGVTVELTEHVLATPVLLSTGPTPTLIPPGPKLQL